MERKKRIVLTLFHSIYVTGIAYAALRFLQTPRQQILARRLWAYEVWLVLGFYTIFLVLTIPDYFTD